MLRDRYTVTRCHPRTIVPRIPKGHILARILPLITLNQVTCPGSQTQTSPNTVSLRMKPVVTSIQTTVSRIAETYSATHTIAGHCIDPDHRVQGSREELSPPTMPVARLNQTIVSRGPETNSHPTRCRPSRCSRPPCPGVQRRSLTPHDSEQLRCTRSPRPGV